MTTLTTAPKRLVTRSVQVERSKDKSVAVIDSKSGSVRLHIPKDDWKAVANYFTAISEEGALL